MEIPLILLLVVLLFKLDYAQDREIKPLEDNRLRYR